MVLPSAAIMLAGDSAESTIANSGEEESAALDAVTTMAINKKFNGNLVIIEILPLFFSSYSAAIQ
jgi:hypothetical protein